jgi:L-threonylcarbamoyladenylate synthase
MSYGGSQEEIAKAVQLLRAGELVAFPTETVYGLGADASNPVALYRLYTAKGRPSTHPVIVHLPALSHVSSWAVDIPSCLEDLAKKFWPGPLTVVLKRAAHVLDQVTGGQDTVAIRVPAHFVAQQLLTEFEGGLAAPSANKFGRLSPTRAEDVAQDFGSELSLILDGGPCQVGIESTILDLSSPMPRILRPGMILNSDIEAVLGAPLEKSVESRAVRVPGALPRHYAPKTKLLLVKSAELLPSLATVISRGEQPAVVSFFEPPPQYAHLRWHRAASDATTFAHDLYSTLHWLDEQGADCIVVESPPDSATWAGVHDRLSRAAAPVRYDQNDTSTI